MRQSRTATLEGQDAADNYLGIEGEKFKLEHAPCPVEVCSMVRNPNLVLTNNVKLTRQFWEYFWSFFWSTTNFVGVKNLSRQFNRVISIKNGLGKRHRKNCQNNHGFILAVRTKVAAARKQITTVICS